MVHTMKTVQAHPSPLRGPAKRRHYDSAFKRHLVELTLIPGASVAKIALDHRINANILFKWRRHYLHELAASTGKPGARLLPVTISEPKEALEVLANGGTGTRSRGRQQRVAVTAGVIEIDLPLGRVRLTGSVELEALRVVLEALSPR
jgi:transposase